MSPSQGLSEGIEEVVSAIIKRSRSMVARALRLLSHETKKAKNFEALAYLLLAAQYLPLAALRELASEKPAVVEFGGDDFRHVLSEEAVKAKGEAAAKAFEILRQECRQLEAVWGAHFDELCTLLRAPGRQESLQTQQQTVVRTVWG